MLWVEPPWKQRAGDSKHKEKKGNVELEARMSSKGNILEMSSSDRDFVKKTDPWIDSWIDLQANEGFKTEESK